MRARHKVVLFFGELVEHKKQKFLRVVLLEAAELVVQPPHVAQQTVGGEHHALARPQNLCLWLQNAGQAGKRSKGGKNLKRNDPTPEK